MAETQGLNKKIHPIIIYPYTHPRDTRGLVALYEGLIKPLEAGSAESKYLKPITVLSGDTSYRILEWQDDEKRKQTYKRFQEDYVDKYSEAIHAWSVDTCQRWLTGLGAAVEKKVTNDDVYWLIPGDFDYANENGEKVLRDLKKLPEKVYVGDCELCLGEITVPLNSSKQLIDTYGTYGLLYNWFPTEAQGIREITDKPRTEFFAIGHAYLTEALKSRWYAYEQTIVILLQGMRGRKPIRTIAKVELGGIVDEPEGRDNLASAMQQVERMERMLKLFWREHQQQIGAKSWPDDFRKLDAQSEEIRGAALIILQQILRG